MSFRNSSWLLAERVARILSGLVVGLAVVRHLGPVNYGIYVFTISAASLGLPVAKLGLEQVAIREFIKSGSLGSRLLLRIFSLRFSGGSLVAIAFIAICRWGFPNVSLNLILIAAIVLPVQAFDTGELWLQSKGFFHFGAKTRLVGIVIGALYRLFLIFINATLPLFLLAWVAESSSASIFNFFLARREIASTEGDESSTCPSPLKMNFNLRELFYVVATAFIAMLYFKLDGLLLPVLLGKRDAGVYLAALPIRDASSFIAAIIASQVFPTLVRSFEKDESEFWKLFFSALQVVTWVGLVTCAAYWVGAQGLFPLILGSKYAGTGLVIAILSLATPIYFQGSIVDAYVFTHKKTAFLAGKSVLAVILKASLFCLLSPSFGLIGAAVASLLAAILATFLATYLLSPLAFKAQIGAFSPFHLVANTLMLFRSI